MPYLRDNKSLIMTAEEIIRLKKLKSTSQRVSVVKCLLEASQPLSEQQIKTAIGEDVDRVTFYRTMKTLQEAEIIHPILLQEQDIVYALSTSHDKEHAHFVCDACHKTLCLEDNQVLSASLPKGYRLQRSSIIIHGLCDECSGGKD